MHGQQNVKISAICLMYIGVSFCETRRRFGTISFEVCEIVYDVRYDPANYK